ncbi:MAG TPA: hypothetical protein VL359_01455 [bacterium]|nr:hypothetical protein [bacterium]
MPKDIAMPTVAAKLRSLPLPSQRALLTLLILVCLLSYALLFGRYRIEEVDDAWLMSMYYNAYTHHILEDVVFGDTPHARFTMASQIFINGLVMTRTGWSKAAIHSINLAWMALAALIWWRIARRVLGRGNQAALLCVVLLFSCEAMMGAAYKGRPDAMAFACASAAVLAYLSAWPVAAGFLLIVAFEVHPVALIAVAYMVGLELHDLLRARAAWPTVRNVLLGALGVLIGLGYYFLLHHVTPLQLLQFLRNDAGTGVNPLYAHFFRRGGLRFLPELAVIVAAFALALRRWRVLARRPAFLMFCVAVLSSFLILRGNFHYAIYFYPAFALLIVDVALELGWQKGLALTASVYFACFYAALLYHNRTIDEAQVQRSYTALALQVSGDKPVFGPPNAWFALKDKGYRYFWRKAGVETLRGPAYLIVSTANPPWADLLACLSPPETWTRLDRFAYAGARISLYAVQAQGCREPPGQPPGRADVSAW